MRLDDMQDRPSESEAVPMNIEQLRRFVDAVEQGSLSKAAKRGRVTVQAVSKSVCDLEREMGVQLLLRTCHGVEPTPFGSHLCAKARPVLEAFDGLRALGARPKAAGRRDSCRSVDRGAWLR